MLPVDCNSDSDDIKEQPAKCEKSVIGILLYMRVTNYSLYYVCISLHCHNTCR